MPTCGSLSISPKRYFGNAEELFQGLLGDLHRLFLEIISSFTACGECRQLTLRLRTPASRV